MNTFWLIVIIFILWSMIGFLITIHSSKYWRKDIDSEATLVVYAFGSIFWPILVLMNLKNYYKDVQNYLNKNEKGTI